MPAAVTYSQSQAAQPCSFPVRAISHFPSEIKPPLRFLTSPTASLPMFSLSHRTTIRKENGETVNIPPWIQGVSAQNISCFATKLFHSHPHFCFLGKGLFPVSEISGLHCAFPSTTSVLIENLDASIKFLRKNSRNKWPLLHRSQDFGRTGLKFDIWAEQSQ